MQDIDTAEPGLRFAGRRYTVALGRTVVVADHAHRAEPSNAWPLPRP